MQDEKFYAYEEPDRRVVVSRSQILREYYPYWSARMDKKWGIGRGRLFDEEDCVADFCIIHWAHEL
jgi:hypothetical protein